MEVDTTEQEEKPYVPNNYDIKLMVPTTLSNTDQLLVKDEDTTPGLCQLDMELVKEEKYEEKIELPHAVKLEPQVFMEKINNISFDSTDEEKPEIIKYEGKIEPDRVTIKLEPATVKFEPKVFPEETIEISFRPHGLLDDALIHNESPAPNNCEENSFPGITKLTNITLQMTNEAPLPINQILEEEVQPSRSLTQITDITSQVANEAPLPVNQIIEEREKVKRSRHVQFMDTQEVTSSDSRIINEQDRYFNRERNQQNATQYPKNIPDTIKHIEGLLRTCSNNNRRRFLLSEKRRLKQLLWSNRNIYNRQNSRHAQISHERRNRTEPQFNTPVSSDGVFVVFHKEGQVSLDDDDDDNEMIEQLDTDLSICSCTQENVSEIEVKLKLELKRLEEMMDSAVDLEKRRLIPKIDKLKHHLCQPHICDYRIPGAKCTWCANPANVAKRVGFSDSHALNCDTVKLKRQLDRLQLLFSIRKSKGEDEKFLINKIKEVKCHIEGLCCGRVKETNNCDVPILSSVASQQPSELHEFFCTCSRCSIEHKMNLKQLKKLNNELGKKI